MLFSLLLIFELIQQAAVVNFMLFLNIFKDSPKYHFEHFESKIDYFCHVGAFFKII